MAVLNILRYPDPRLHRIAEPVREVDEHIRQLVRDMAETMYAAPGIGLAATQVDFHKQLIVIDVSDGKDQPIVLINPKITHRDGEQVYQEGCLSVPGIYADVTRANTVRVEALNRRGEVYAIEADGLLAVCIQHEMDHLAGKVFVDYLSPLKREMVRKKLAKQSRDKRSAPDREHSI